MCSLIPGCVPHFADENVTVEDVLLNCYGVLLLHVGDVLLDAVILSKLIVEVNIRMFVGLNLGVHRKCARKVFAVKLDCSKQTN